MGLELRELGQHATGRDSSGEDLAGVDVHGTVFPGVIDLENSRGELSVFAGCGVGLHVVQRMKRADGKPHSGFWVRTLEGLERIRQQYLSEFRIAVAPCHVKSWTLKGRCLVNKRRDLLCLQSNTEGFKVRALRRRRVK